MSEFPTNWTRMKIGQFAKRVKRKNSNRICNNVLTISANDGLISQKEFFKKIVASKNTSGYTLLENSEFAYNKSYCEGFPVGAARRLRRYSDGIVSPLYICFCVNQELLDLKYADYLFDSQWFNSAIYSVAKEGGRSHGLLNLGINEFFDASLPIPPLHEQKKISEILFGIDNLIQKNKIKLDKLSLLKDALIQHLLLKGLDLHTYQKTSIGIFPNSWEIVGINSVCKFIKRGPSLSTNPLGKGIRYITSGNIVNDKISLEADYKFLDNFEGIDKCLIKKDDLILNCVNSKAKLASSALYSNNISSIVGFNNYALTIDDDRCLPSFIFYWTKTPNFYTQVKSFSKPAINQASFSKKDLEKIQIPLPSIEEQLKICQVIDPIFALQEELQIKIKKYISCKRGIANDLLLGRKRVKF